MPLVAVVVGAIGSAVGTAIGAAIGGSIMGVAAATIGGVIGAGIAGGVLAAATGGSFGKGFLMGAAGGAMGAFLKGGLSSSFGGGEALGGATQFADGTTTAEMLAAQGGAEFAPDALSGMGDVAGTAAEAGIGELGFGGGAETFGLGESIMPQAEPLTPSFEGGLQDTVNAQSMGFMDTGFGGGSDLATSAGFSATPTPSTDQFAMTPGMTGESPMLSGDYSYAPTDTGTQAVSGGLENITSTVGGTGGATPGFSGAAGGPTAAQTTPAPSQGGLGGLMKTSDAWLQKNLGMPQGSTGKLLMGGADSLMKMYEANKLERQVKGMAPMSFEEFQTQFSDPNAYKVAANKMAKSGRTGTLPVLLARMKNDVRGKYAGYLPQAQQQYLGNQAGVSALKTSALNNLFTPFAQNLAMKGTS